MCWGRCEGGGCVVGGGGLGPLGGGATTGDTEVGAGWGTCIGGVGKLVLPPEFFRNGGATGGGGGAGKLPPPVGEALGGWWEGTLTADPSVEPVIIGPLITGPLITGPPESPELPELTEIMDGALVIFLCSEAGEAGMVQLWEGGREEKKKEIEIG